jgi:hypothetical protein
VTLAIPVTNDNPVLILGISIRNRDQQTTEDSKTTETTCGSLKTGGRVVKVTSDLILHLEVIGIVSSRKDGA